MVKMPTLELRPASLKDVIEQALLNIVDNAIEAVDARNAADGAAGGEDDLASAR